jgi:hypothetical protein
MRLGSRGIRVAAAVATLAAGLTAAAAGQANASTTADFTGTGANMAQAHELAYFSAELSGYTASECRLVRAWLDGDEAYQEIACTMP